ncbi:MAG: DoxX family protein [Acidobacteriota bacterium]|jgi:hypothetical protein
MRKWIDIGAQALLGLVFFVFGLNGFLGFLPLPELPEPAGRFLGALAETGYLLYLVKGIEVVAGFLLLIRKFSALALLLLAPGVVNIFLFHAFLAPGGLPLAILVVLLEAYLGFVVHFDRFRSVFRP